MDGPRVVYSTDGNGVYVWNVRSGATWQVRARSKSDHPLVQEVAIAGQRLAWVTRSVVGNSMETNEHLYSASLLGARTTEVAHAFRIWSWNYGPNVLSQWDGGWITGLVGAGKSLAVSRWTERPTADWSGTTISNASLSLISAGRAHPIATGEQSIVSKSVDAGHVAVLRSEGSVGIYSTAGLLLREITPSSANDIAMGGGRLVVLTKTKTLEVYDTRTGVLQHTWPVRTRAAYLQAGHLQAYGRIALYSVDPRYYSRNLTILDLKTGKSIVLPARPRSAWNDACVGPLGLVYSLNSYEAYGGHHPSGTLFFLTTARVLAGISRGHLG
jgi:hypothetical protein